jgi:hypothetical protein
MICIGQYQRRAQFFEIAGRHAFDSRRRADGREDGRGNNTMWRVEYSRTGAANLSELFVGEVIIGHGST